MHDCTHLSRFALVSRVFPGRNAKKYTGYCIIACVPTWWIGLDSNQRRLALQATLYRLSYRSMVPRQGLEPWAPALIVRCSTTELTGQRKDSGGNRTHDQSFADSCLNRLTTESWSGWLDLHQRSPEAADLQSAAIAAMRHPDIMHRPYWPGAIFNA